jgi:hypothetical protein
MLLSCLVVRGQGEIDTQEKILFQNERSISLQLNTNGYGAGFIFGKRTDYLSKRIYAIDFVFIKDPKEIKVASDYAYYTSSRKYVFGKLNTFMNLRPSYGFQKEIFSKEDKGSIAIKYYFSGGPSIGITKPIYYSFNVIDTIIDGYYYIHEQEEKWEFNDNHQVQLLGVGGHAAIYKGLNEMKLYLGVHAKFGFTFEYSSSNRLINSIDAGIVVDAFTRKIPIMYNEYNRQLFITLFAAYRFGWVVDAKYRTPKITREGKRKSDQN